MAAGLWTHRDLASDVFTFEDLVDIHELLDVRDENERRCTAHAKQKQEA